MLREVTKFVIEQKVFNIPIGKVVGETLNTVCYSLVHDVLKPLTKLIVQDILFGKLLGGVQRKGSQSQMVVLDEDVIVHTVSQGINLFANRLVGIIVTIGVILLIKLVKSILGDRLHFVHTPTAQLIIGSLPKASSREPFINLPL